MKNMRKLRPITILERLDQWWNRVTGREHVYFAEVQYRMRDGRPAPGSPYISGYVGLTYRASMPRTARALRLFYGSRLAPALRPSQKHNGKMVIERLTYMGRMTLQK
ncbi:hypothetical protein AhyVDH1_038 [Aeromonas phage AhyVDH1]|nr:hypothetical protein AhyVDH1_038 [Aeromonas phage AhyVDH1]